MITKISAIKAKEIMDTVNPIYIVDVREKYEYDEAHIKNALCIPLGRLCSRAEVTLSDKRLPVLIYCSFKGRAENAALLLSEIGYENIFVFGGMLSWPYETEQTLY